MQCSTCKSANHAGGVHKHEALTSEIYIRRTSLGVGVLTGEAVAVRVLVNGGAGRIQTEHAQDQTNEGDGSIKNGEGNLAGRGEPLALVEVQPVNTAETVAEPASEQSTL